MEGNMKNAAYLLITIAIILCAYAFSMDVTVAVGDGTRVNNIGLMSEQQNYVIFSGFLLVAGIICAKKSRRKETPRDIKKTESIEPSSIFDEENGALKEDQIKALAVSLIEKYPRLDASDIMRVSAPTVDSLAKNYPKPVSKQFKLELEKWIKFYS
jgi:hypothetical protein